MLEAETTREATHAMVELTNYGALGICLVLALIAIVLLFRALREEQRARIEDAKAYMELALELQQRESGKIEKLEIIASVLKKRGSDG
jgi:hypothetical protein